MIHFENLLSLVDIDRIIEMAWEDHTSFDAIEKQFGLSESQVIDLMRRHSKPSSFRMWRARVTNRHTKHDQLSPLGKRRFKSTLQKDISHNKISKR